jgi:hypothetical protein
MNEHLPRLAFEDPDESLDVEIFREEGLIDAGAYTGLLGVRRSL